MHAVCMSLLTGNWKSPLIKEPKNIKKEKEKMVSKTTKKKVKEMDKKISQSSKQMRKQAAENSEAKANAGNNPGKKAGPPRLPGSIEERTLTVDHPDLGEMEVTTWVASFEGENYTNKSRAACARWIKEKRAHYKIEHGKDIAIDRVRKMITANKERLEKIGKNNKEYLSDDSKDLLKESISFLDEFLKSIDLDL